VIVAFAALTGLIVGSYLNVIAYRIPQGMSVVRPPSRCPACGSGIRARGVVDHPARTVP
jgi:leader peptidase (prepilin peptidase)/N-methyltransferase